MRLKLLLCFFILIFCSSDVLAWSMTPELRKEINEKEAALRKNPDSAFTRFDLAVTYSYSNKILEAWDTLKKIPELDPTFKEKGLAFYVDKVRKDPGDWKMRFRLAFALYFNGRKEEAIQQFKYVLVSDPNNVWAYGYISLAYGEMNNIDEGIKWAQKGIKVDKLVAALHLLLSQGYYRKGDNGKGFLEAAETIRLKALGY
ncbi:hypothetical protein A2276_06390 [candidate division WOR-1 bacterium RIFOXYA12_FULL_43_27]|uniref:Tetratricopeptide repeat-like domain-containing protein n=1 Tax=candidate division WOR-1 bacterium RIFOXYC2_FULL_46_14 TaxID=1802587 RepID=A0A1F4U5A8_UNCSA|nr:MAG: hypothetical protein A2276_06390 [candidate division WOR-1 bacterium RIFOXYA12_FULL_43_27]OGC20280.1 MAG: hypothetical protein A2292_04390 [candidate division WOR-1 bacterium RIFOXYB2_FULL_46_45]OGC31983.1 MAG: hypothetical protein A2232_07060 [candidate division WOR-1 bacterium RIFOXYA2_FULL_46_56]OGC40126.1 MAG: hypothetical protein A2438_02410 [candidate division WOR-1 bacterium RIFOXYC2_FULL_46_14]